MEDEVERLEEPEMVIPSRKQCFPNSTGQMYRQSHKDCSSMHKTLISKHQTKFLGERKIGGHKDPPLGKELLAFDCIYVRETQFSLVE